MRAGCDAGRARRFIVEFVCVEGDQGLVDASFVGGWVGELGVDLDHALAKVGG